MSILTHWAFSWWTAIELSEHFVYIENQFFITSTVVDGVPIQNGIGDALVDRIIRAHKEKTPWKCCVVIPLLPGYTYPIDSGEGSSVRLIMECQNRTISRGSASIFSRLRKEGIDVSPNTSLVSGRGDLKLMFSPRNTWPSSHFEDGVNTNPAFWPLSKFTSTERPVLLMIVSLLSRSSCRVRFHRTHGWCPGLVLCGSANINERSQRGDRDSELLSVIRDTDMIDGYVLCTVTLLSLAD